MRQEPLPSNVVSKAGPVTAALDNGRRSPAKLLRAVVARLLGRKVLVVT